MEFLKKTILQVLTTGTTVGGDTIIIPDLSVTYYLKIGLKQVGHDVGFMDAYSEPPEPQPPVPPSETFYLVDNEGNVFTDNNGDKFLY